MSWNDALNALQGAVLGVFGIDGTYHRGHGDPVALERLSGTGVVIDRSVEVMTEGGGYDRLAVASLKSGLVKPGTGDWIETRAGNWTVGAPMADDGVLMQLAVRPRP